MHRFYFSLYKNQGRQKSTAQKHFESNEKQKVPSGPMFAFLNVYSKNITAFSSKNQISFVHN